MIFSENLTNSLLQTGILVDKFYTPILCLVGAFGNCLSLAVFWLDSKFRNQSSSFYLSALAVSDTGFLVNLFLVWCQGVHGHVITSPITCPLVMYLGQITCFTSVYLTIAFSFERYVAVHYPFSRPRLCTRAKAKRVIFGVICVALIAFTYVWVIAKVIEVKPSPLTTCSNNELPLSLNLTNTTTTDEIKLVIQQHQNTSLFDDADDIPEEKAIRDFLKRFLSYASVEKVQNITVENISTGQITPQYATCYYQCTVPQKYYEVSEIANYLDSVFTLVLPFILITYLNLSIYKSVWKYINERHQNSTPRIPTPAIKVLTTDIVRSSNPTPGTYTPKPSRSSSSSSHMRNSGDRNLKPGKNRWCDKHQGKGKRAVRFEMNCCSSTSSSGRPGLTSKRENLPREPPRTANLCQVRSIEQEHFAVRLTHAPLEVRVTKTLLLVSTVFLVLNLPLHTIRCAQFILYMSDTQGGMDILRAIQPWATLLFNTNFAVNFFLYCVSGRNFRKSLNRTIISRLVKKSQPEGLELSFIRNQSRHSGHFSSGFIQNWARKDSDSGRVCGENTEYATALTCPGRNGALGTELLEMTEIVPFGITYADTNKTLREDDIASES